MRFKKLTSTQLFFIWFGLATLIYAPIAAYKAYIDGITAINSERDRHIQLLSSISKKLFKAGADEALTDILRDSIAQHKLGYFVVFKNGKMVHAEPSNEILAVGNDYEERKNQIGRHLSDDVRSELSEYLGNDTVLTMGRRQISSSAFLDVIFKTDTWWMILKSYLGILLIGTVVVYAHMREISNLAKQIEKAGRIQRDQAA